ncbi:hypothetical protein WS91_17230 [Burkholderia sp. MSMB1498]|nr:hypothetical protein WS91_17230 [Burkholderia sp. MSMB1498]
MGGGAMSTRNGKPDNDLTGLTQYVAGFDAGHYVDEQAQRIYEDALVKWPLLARLMGLEATSRADRRAVG